MTRRWADSTWTASLRPLAAFLKSRWCSTSTRTDRARLRQGSRDRERAEDRHHGLLRPVQGRRREDGPEAESHAADDKKQRESIDARNRADQLVYQTEKELQENGEKVPADDQASLRAALDATKVALGGSDADAIKTSAESLERARMKFGEAVYRAASGPDRRPKGLPRIRRAPNRATTSSMPRSSTPSLARTEAAKRRDLLDSPGG
jgi:hypothetical protein